MQISGSGMAFAYFTPEVSRVREPNPYYFRFSHTGTRTPSTGNCRRLFYQ